MKVKKIDSFRMNLAESAVYKDFKLKNTKGMGEKRIYVGNDEKNLDEFFDFENVKCFFMYKSDILKYLELAKIEYDSPSQIYKNDISKLYDKKKEAIEDLEIDRLEINFTKKYDKQYRYYLNFANSISRKNWNYFLSVAIPRLTKLDFLKVQDVKNNELYIYIKPTFLITAKSELSKETLINIKELNGKKKSGYRPYQEQFRNDVLERLPYCIFTGVSEDRILDACHIKDDCVCNKVECKDVNNGLTMTPTYHRLFDSGLISFTSDGTVLVSEFLSRTNKVKLNLESKRRCTIPSGCEKYMIYHRENVFLTVNKDLKILQK